MKHSRFHCRISQLERHPEKLLYIREQVSGRAVSRTLSAGQFIVLLPSKGRLWDGIKALYFRPRVQHPDTLYISILVFFTAY